MPLPFLNFIFQRGIKGRKSILLSINSWQKKSGGRSVSNIYFNSMQVLFKCQVLRGAMCSLCHHPLWLWGRWAQGTIHLVPRQDFYLKTCEWFLCSVLHLIVTLCKEKLACNTNVYFLKILIFKQLPRNNFVGGKRIDKGAERKRVFFVSIRIQPSFKIHVLLPTNKCTILWFLFNA